MTPARRLPRVGALVALLAVVTAASTSAYVLFSGTPRFPDGQIVMHLQLGTSGTLTDGAAGWGPAAEAAMSIWNPYMDKVQFAVIRNSTVPIADGDGVNSIFWSSTWFGKPFTSVGSGSGYGALAVTTRWTRGSTRTEADIIFNNQYSWNSYRGALRTGTITTRVYDFRRVAIHELGHVLGLDHPDQNGQTVTAQMNSTTGDLDTVAADDIAGARALYQSSFGSGTVAFPPQNETADFRSQLETQYRNGLRRSPTILTYVDALGDAVWTSEYLRYRVNQCSDSAATQRVLDAINGQGTAAVCGSSPVGTVTFPPRNESLSFRTQLEAVYRDTLKRATTATAVDNEGDVVWTQEYLRYRVNGCDHQTAITKVIQQISGLGVQPVCR